jgi:hypothetical protein
VLVLVLVLVLVIVLVIVIVIVLVIVIEPRSSRRGAEVAERNPLLDPKSRRPGKRTTLARRPAGPAVDSPGRA